MYKLLITCYFYIHVISNTCSNNKRKIIQILLYFSVIIPDGFWVALCESVCGILNVNLWEKYVTGGFNWNRVIDVRKR